MNTNESRALPHRLRRTVAGALLAAPLALAGVAAIATSASASTSSPSHADGGAAASLDAAAAAEVSPAICANCHQTLNHVAPLATSPHVSTIPPAPPVD